VQMGNVDLLQKNEMKYLRISREDWHRQSIPNRKENSSTKKRNKWTLYSEEDNTIKRKQTPPIQSSGPMEFSYGGQPPIPISKSSSASIQVSPIYSECTLVHKQPQDPWISTNEHSAKWNKKANIKYLRKLGNHTNVLAVNLLDNSETTHRLKRYTVLTLLDRTD
jgi:hypothetical protein